MALLQNYIINTIRRTEQFLNTPKNMIFLNQQDFLDFISKYGGSKQYDFDKIHGHHWMRPNCKLCKNCNGHYAIWINLESNKSIRRLNMTLIHEVLHTTHRGHSKLFYNKVIKTCNALFYGNNFKPYKSEELGSRINSLVS